MKHVCFECGTDNDLHAHHVVPKSRGGKKTVLLCDVCHSKAHHRDKNMNTSTLTKIGIMKRRELGKWQGRPPFGYEVNKSGFLIKSDDYHIVQKIMEMRFGPKPLKLRQIVDEMNKIAPQEPWSDVKIHRIIKFNKKQDKK